MNRWLKVYIDTLRLTARHMYFPCLCFIAHEFSQEIDSIAYVQYSTNTDKLRFVAKLFLLCYYENAIHLLN